jgi:GT2 family glycosyltransferase
MAQLSTRAAGPDRRPRRKEPSVLVVLVVRDGEPWLRDCLRSLGRQTYPRLGIVAVDNDSTDGSVELLRRALGPDRVITLDENRGLPAAVQAALRQEVAGRADYVLILHDDAALEPDAVARLVEVAERVDGVGVVGPKIVDWENPRILRGVGSATDRFGYPYSPLEEDELDQGQYDRVREVLFVSSCAMLVSRAALQRAGPPDDRFESKQEDVDFCWRVRLAGFRVLMVPTGVVRHLAASVRGERDGAGPTRSRYHVERATLAAMLKNFGFVSLLWLFPLFVIQGLAKLVTWAVSRRFEDLWQLLAAWGWNVVHLPGTLRRRVRTQSVRSIPDRSLRRYMAPLTVRVRGWIESARTLTAREEPELDTERPLEEQEELELPSLGARTMGFARAHPVATAWVLVAVVAAFAYRHIVGPGPVQGGAIEVFPSTPGAFFTEVVSAVRTTGLGGTEAASPALAGLGALSAVMFGSTELALKALLILLPALAGLAFYRATVRQGAQRIPSVVGALCYGLSPLMLWSLSEGRIPELVLLAVLPPLAARVQTAFGPSRPRSDPRFALEGGLLLAGAAAFLPGALLAFALIVMGHLASPPREGSARRGLALSGGMLGGAAVLLFPFAASMVFGGGLQLHSLAGVPSFDHLVRLAPDGGPGSWSVAWFLPIVALVGFTLVEGGARRAAWRYLAVGVAGVYLAWLSAAGYLPPQLANAPSYLAAAALAYCTLVVRGLGAMIGMGRRAFGYRHLAVGLIGAVLAVGLGLQAGVAALGGWRIGRDNLPPAWPLVARGDPGTDLRILWLTQRVGSPLPAPGGDPVGTVTVGRTTLRFSIGGRAGPGALDLGRAADGEGYGYLQRALSETLSGTTTNGGALLGPLSIRYLVSAKGDLPGSVRARLDQQVDLDLVRAGGLTIYRNDAFLPEAWGSAHKDLARAAHSGSLLDVVRIAREETVPVLHPAGHGELTGSTGSGVVVLSQQFDSGWRADVGGRRGPSPYRAFGWATGFDLPAGTVHIEYGRQWIRTVEMIVLALLWVFSLWLTRKPSAGARPARARIPHALPEEQA